jgi:hypothetical protein
MKRLIIILFVLFGLSSSAQYIDWLGIPCSQCDDLYSWTQAFDGTYCYRVETISPIQPTESYVWFATSYTEYSVNGTKLFDPNYNADGTGSYTLLNTADVWKNITSTDGPMNRCSVWVDNIEEQVGSNDLYHPLSTWIGFTHCEENLTVNKTYYIGVAADNLYRLSINGELLLETPFVVTSDQETFQYWHVYPVVANTESITLTIEGYNNESIAGFGVQIYDATAAELAGMSSVSALNAVTIFSSDTEVGFLPDVGGLGYGYSCAEGYYYDECSQTCSTIIKCYNQ